VLYPQGERRRPTVDRSARWRVFQIQKARKPCRASRNHGLRPRDVERFASPSKRGGEPNPKKAIEAPEAAGDDRSCPRALRLRLGRRCRGREAARLAPCARGVEHMLEQSSQRPGGPRKGGPSAALCDRASARTRAISPRQLPTDHDHDGEPRARSANIRVINRRAGRTAAAWSAPQSLQEDKWRWS